MIVASYNKLEDAQLAVSLLEGNGIPAYLRDGHTVHTYWLYANAVGGVKVEVAEEHEALAREILALPPEPEPEALLARPHCGSAEVRLREMNLFAAICITLGFLLPIRSRRVDCMACEKSFRLDERRSG